MKRPFAVTDAELAMSLALVIPQRPSRSGKVLDQFEQLQNRGPEAGAALDPSYFYPLLRLKFLTPWCQAHEANGPHDRFHSIDAEG